MRSGLGSLAIAALAAGAGIMGTACRGSLRVPSKDASDSLDGASLSGGVSGTGSLLGAGGATGRGGAGRGGASGSGGVSGAGGSGTDAGARDVNVDATPVGPIDATVVDPKQFCEMWQTRTSAQDAIDLQHFALFKADTVLAGTLGDYVEAGETSYAQLSVDRVRAGIRPYEGLASAIRIERTLYDQLGKGARVIAGIGQPDPFVDKNLGLPVWDQPQALLASSSTVAPELLEFHAWNTPNVAVLRVEEVSEGGIRFALVESLHGAFPPALQMPLSSYRPSLGMTVGSTWIGGFGELMNVTVPSVAPIELRPDTPEERAAVANAFKALEPTGFATRYQAEIEQAKADAIRLRLAWLYNQADLVAALEVTGKGMECCTNLGGIFHGSSVLEVLHGPAPAGQVLTGGHGYYGQKACGDRYLYAFGSPVVLADGLVLDCEGKANVGEGPGSRVLHEIPVTADSLALARQGVTSAPPLLRLYPAGAQLASEAFSLPASIALWSAPLSPLTAVLAGTPVILTVESVTKRAEGYVVGIRTPFYVREYSHLEQYQVELAFACADPRLLEVGAHFIGSVVGTEVVNANTVAPAIEQRRLLLAPGLLLPERSDVIRALGLLPTVVLP
jgi:hypothetical protein